MKTPLWITDDYPLGTDAPLFCREFSLKRPVRRAMLSLTARGVYEAHLNGQRVGDFVLAPGWTEYESTQQVQEYDVTALLRTDNRLTVQLANGWYLGEIVTRQCEWHYMNPERQARRHCAIYGKLDVEWEDGTRDVIVTDETWRVSRSPWRLCDIWDGIEYDARVEPCFDRAAVISPNQDTAELVPQIGEPVREQERFPVKSIFRTPAGETVVDFGQNLSGYPEITVTAHAGDVVDLSFAEVMDADGNFYTENYRAAKAGFLYICREGTQTFKPSLTFYGYRYVRINRFPGEVRPEQLTSIAVYSALRRTGYIETSHPLLNQLFSNVLWGQRSNYVDVPTDCPQRDERLGWTGDAQVFARAASYNFDVRRFFRKWLRDMRNAQYENGGIPIVIPDLCPDYSAAAWSDAVTIIPWQLYLTYGDTEFLISMFPAMKRWVDYITATTPTPYRWTDHFQYGDWVGLDAEPGSYRGASREDLIATAFYARSTELVCKVGHLLGEDVRAYETLYADIARTFRSYYATDLKTQTECIVALWFRLTDDRQGTAERLVSLIHAAGDALQTGFVGTPYLLHVLSDTGYTDLAYQLLLKTDYPSWLYPVTKGATTIWEHWDNLRPDGSFWSADMNSFNHYAYGSVADWLYGVCAGIQTVEEEPGFRKIRIAPQPTDRLEHFGASLDTDYGRITSRWWHENGRVCYEIVTPRPAEVYIDGVCHTVEAGMYRF